VYFDGSRIGSFARYWIHNGLITVNGQKAVQMLCYFGSSTYDTKEFSTLLDGVISEMQEMGLEVPVTADMERALEMWEKQNEKVV
jgi:hypothetical protein